tara:strand:+ start:2507 stop:3382 length:876 start_codon:yes stop_codon:yes gene_type:complete
LVEVHKIRGPDLICAGAPKAATTSIFESLIEVGLAKQNIKEFNYFSRECVNHTGYYGDAREWTKSKYEGEMSRKKSELNLDFSPSYFSCPSTPIKIKTNYPNVRILFVLRNPIERAFSHYMMDKRLNLVDFDLSEIIDEEIEPYYSEYVENSKYLTNLNRYFQVFDKDSILILSIEDLRRDFQESMRCIMKHIGVTEKYNFDVKKRNENRFYRNAFFKFLATNNFAKGLYRMLPAKNLINKIVYQKNLGNTGIRPTQKLKILLSDDCDLFEDISNLPVPERSSFVYSKKFN